MKDIEVMMQNLLKLAFDTVVTVDQGIDLLEVFMHLSYREVCLVYFLSTESFV